MCVLYILYNFCLTHCSFCEELSEIWYKMYKVIQNDCLGLTTCHTQYTSDSSICIFLFNRTTLQVFVTHLTVLYMCTLCDSTNINTKIEFVPNCL